MRKVGFFFKMQTPWSTPGLQGWWYSTYFAYEAWWCGDDHSKAFDLVHFTQVLYGYWSCRFQTSSNCEVTSSLHRDVKLPMVFLWLPIRFPDVQAVNFIRALQKESWIHMNPNPSTECVTTHEVTLVCNHSLVYRCTRKIWDGYPPCSKDWHMWHGKYPLLPEDMSSSNVSRRYFWSCHQNFSRKHGSHSWGL